MQKRMNPILLVLVLLSGFLARSARASDIDVVLNKLVEKGVITSVEAQEIRNEIGGEAKQRDDQQKAAVQEAASGIVPKWTQAIAWSGDLRLRDETIWRPTAPDRHRERIRLRTGLRARVNDHLDGVSVLPPGRRSTRSRPTRP